jgi:hypothetical protein
VAVCSERRRRIAGTCWEGSEDFFKTGGLNSRRQVIAPGKSGWQAARLKDSALGGMAGLIGKTRYPLRPKAVILP